MAEALKAPLAPTVPYSVEGHLEMAAAYAEFRPGFYERALQSQFWTATPLASKKSSAFPIVPVYASMELFLRLNRSQRTEPVKGDALFAKLRKMKDVKVHFVGIEKAIRSDMRSIDNALTKLARERTQSESKTAISKKAKPTKQRSRIIPA